VSRSRFRHVVYRSRPWPTAAIAASCRRPNRD
jgi:hypothetical protein